MQRMTYHESHPVTSEDAEAAFASNNPEAIAFALVNVVFHDPDWRWVQERCLEFTQHSNASVRQIAVTCLGHVARIHRKLDLEKVSQTLSKLSYDPEIQVEDAISDIRIFMGVDLKLN